MGATGLASESEAPCEKAPRPLASYSHRRAGARSVVPVCGGTARIGPGSGSPLQVLGAAAPVGFPLRSLASQGCSRGWFTARTGVYEAFGFPSLTCRRSSVTCSYLE